MKIGVLALQGGFDAHSKRLAEIGVESVLIRNESELDSVEGLIIPGGESTTLLKLCDKSFRDKIASKVKAGFPILTTCAGTILIANEVSNPPQESLKLIDIGVERNAYGRQVDSFITKEIESDSSLSKDPFEVVFIRAPKIISTGKDVKVLVKCGGEPVLVQSNNVLAATFHPELSSSGIVHQYFTNLVEAGILTKSTPIQ